jgi:outer membrane usher protein
VAAADLQRSLPLGAGYGYRLRAETGTAGAVDGDLRYQSRYGRYELRQLQAGGEPVTSLSASGALVGIGGRLFAARPVEQSFALVRVPGVPNVRAYVSNQEIGRTDRRGTLLVPNLLPYYGNQLRIADEDVPLAMTVRERALTLAPPWRGGAVALFPVMREQRVTGEVRLEQDGIRDVPAYGRLVVTAGDTTAESPIGAGGEYYLEGVPAGVLRAVIEHGDRRCAFDLRVPESEAPVTRLGTATCVVR